ncbi:MAG: hypothetical protein R3A45_13375 [Bdellovibrionota bacterium]
MFNQYIGRKNEKIILLLLQYVCLPFTFQASDHTGELAIGYQSSFNAAGSGGLNPINGNWSVKYGLASNMNLQFLLGFGLTDASNSAAYSFGARFLYDLIENENSDF